MELEDIKVSTEMLLQGSLVFALLDAVYIPLLTWRIRPLLFKQLKWLLVLISGGIWFGIWQTVLTVFWESVYVYVFPIWAKNWIPLAFGTLMAAVSLGIWSLAQRGPSHPLPIFCLLAGTWGVLTHTWAIDRGIMTNPPMLQGASLYAALLIAFFEYIFYWCVIITLAGLIGWIWQKLRRRRQGYN
jgi:hypothetical protein